MFRVYTHHVAIYEFKNVYRTCFVARRLSNAYVQHVLYYSINGQQLLVNRAYDRMKEGLNAGNDYGDESVQARTRFDSVEFLALKTLTKRESRPYVDGVAVEIWSKQLVVCI